jgi:hypothetical protein
MTLPAVASDPAAQQNDQALDKRLATIEGAAVQRPLVMSLPAPATDGQEVYYLADAANGIVWHLRYRAASSSPYKWECVAGAALIAEVGAGGTVIGSIYALPSGSIAAVALPLAGDYEVQVFGNVQTSATGMAVFATPAVNANPDAIDANALVIAPPNLGIATSSSRKVLRTGMASGAALKPYFRHGSTSGTVTVNRTLLAVRPRRVG